MPVDFASIKKATANKPPRVLLYAAPGDGKTTFASSFPDPIFIQTEDGTPTGVEFDTFGRIKNFSGVMEAIGSLYEGDHNYKTLVVDSISSLQPMIFAETCARGDEKGVAKKSIEEFPYGKGYVFAQKVLAEFIDGINALRDERNMAIVLIAHAQIRRFDDPETQSFDRYEVDMHNKLSPIIERDMDCIFLLKKQTTIKTQDVGFNKERAYAEGGGSIFIHTESRPAYVAKNRMGMPHKIRLEKTGGYSAVAPYFPKVS
jgi:hypothetical protein